MWRTGRSCWRELGARSRFRKVRDWFDWLYTPEVHVLRMQWAGLADTQNFVVQLSA
jgi:hypothetical protein